MAVVVLRRRRGGGGKKRSCEVCTLQETPRSGAYLKKVWIGSSGDKYEQSLNHVEKRIKKERKGKSD
jgi:hypothetical protein